MGYFFVVFIFMEQYLNKQVVSFIKENYMKTYRIIAVLLIAAALLMGGCDNGGMEPVIDHPPQTEQQPQDVMQPGEGSKISFDLPDGWEFNPETKLKARLPEPPTDSVLQSTVLELGEFHEGTAEQAEKMADETYKSAIEGEEEKPTLTETEIGGHKTYVLERHTNSYWGDYWWDTTVIFEKDGFIGSFHITDRFENQKEAIEKVITSIVMSED
jgi:hypothetical protein